VCNGVQDVSDDHLCAADNQSINSWSHLWRMLLPDSTLNLCANPHRVVIVCVRVEEAAWETHCLSGQHQTAINLASAIALSASLCLRARRLRRLEARTDNEILLSDLVETAREGDEEVDGAAAVPTRHVVRAAVREAPHDLAQRGREAR
jgi:hypothetical protein